MSFVFPASLEVIEEEAFSGTAAKAVVFQQNLRSIGERAFEDARNITSVFLPAAIEYIADSAFSVYEGLVLYGKLYSSAQKWAEEHSVLFVVENLREFVFSSGKTAFLRNANLYFLLNALSPESFWKILPQAEDEFRSMRPQDRPELNPIDYRFP